MSLQRALLLLVVSVLLAGLLPAGFLVNRRLESALVEGARSDLAMAPRILDDRLEMKDDAQMMHVMEAAGVPGLAEAMAREDWSRAEQLLRSSVEPAGEEPLLVTGDRRVVVGPPVEAEVLQRAREGGYPVEVSSSGSIIRSVALGAVRFQGRIVGFVGVWTPLDQGEAGVLAGLTASDVLITDGDARLVAFTGDSARAERLLEARGAATGSEGTERRDQASRDQAGRDADPGSGTSDGEARVLEVETGGETFLLASAPWGPAEVTFVRSLDQELAVVPQIRRIGAVSLVVALLFAAVVGGVFAAMLGRPVQALASAANRVSRGDFYAPIPDSGVKEVKQVAEAFGVMREALARRFAELKEANRELEDRQERLSTLQAELIQRDRLAAAGRLLAQLAHEIRNPVANVRNCLEVLRRRAPDRESREFADLAIDEILRMHELAEQMLDLNRPGDPGKERCDAAEIGREVARLVNLGVDDDPVTVRRTGAEEAPCTISADALKQVLLNLVQNAREAMDGEGEVELAISTEDDVVAIEVRDQGPGIPEDLMDRVFDPFFTTKSSLQGVGLGLFIAEATVRRHGGRITAINREDGPGAVFRVELPTATGPGRAKGETESVEISDPPRDEEAGREASPGAARGEEAAAGPPPEGSGGET